MGRITIDEYYLTEQDEPTVRVQLGARAVAAQRPRQASAAGGAPVRQAKSRLRRRLRAIRRAAGIVLAA